MEKNDSDNLWSHRGRISTSIAFIIHQVIIYQVALTLSNDVILIFKNLTQN